MHLEYTEDHQMLSDMLGRFIAKEYSFDIRDEVANSAVGHSPEIWRQLADNGIVGALFDESVGGFGGRGFDIALIFEGLGRGIVPEPFLAALLGGSCIAAGSDAQKALLDELIGGQSLVTLAHSEPQNRYDIQDVVTNARRDGDSWLLNGYKIMVPFGSRADIIVVSARTAGELRDESGISLFLVRGDTSGLTRHGYNNVDGGLSADIEFSEVRVNDDALLGVAGDGHAILAEATRRGVLALSAEALGTMETTKEMTLEYLRNRRQFGVPIGTFQALQHRMADVLIAIEQVRSAVINAASALDGGRLAAERMLAAAKYTAGRTGKLVAEEAIQLHGGNGMAWEVPLSHYAKRLIMIDHQLGDEDYHLERFIALGGAEQ